MMSAIIENQIIEKLARQFHRSPLQKNQLHQTDAEIVRLSPNSDMLLAITTDSIVEEIAVGLYNDPYLIGWMTVIVNMSDLAAVGAQPIGILISEVLPAGYPDTSLARLQQGIQDACAASTTYVLGGDTNFGEQFMLTGCALGTLSPRGHLSRIGCQPADVLYSTNVLGAGNAFALSALTRIPTQFTYRPCARLKEGQSLCGIATACMDTSDGVIATLDQLMRLNNVGFELDKNWEMTLHAGAIQVAERARIPSWLLLAGQHGEFELLFTVPEHLENKLIQVAEENNWRPLRVGKVIEETTIYLTLYGERVSLDTGGIRNLSHLVNGNVELYIHELLRLDEEIQKGVMYHVSK